MNSKIIFKAKSKYSNIYVTQEGNCLFLNFNTGLAQVQSGIDLSRPYFHVFDYSLLAMHSFLFLSNPKKILLIGLGGGIIYKHIERYFGDSKIDIIELDEEVVNIARNFFWFKKRDSTMIHIGDASNIVKDIKEKYDMVIIDAFDSHYIPKKLMEPEFIKDIKNITHENSLVTWNMSVIHPSYNSHLVKISEVFKNIYVLNGPRNYRATMAYITDSEVSPRDFVSFCPELNLKPKKIDCKTL